MTNTEFTESEALQMIAEAEALADEIRRAAQEEAEQMRRAADEAGAQEGMAQAEQTRAQIAAFTEKVLGELPMDALRASLSTAADLIQEDMNNRETAIVDLVATALSVARDARDVVIRAHPLDTAKLRTQKERLMGTLSRARDLDIRADRRVKQGGVLVQTESGVVDAQLQTQLDELGRVIGI